MCITPYRTCTRLGIRNNGATVWQCSYLWHWCLHAESKRPSLCLPDKQVRVELADVDPPKKPRLEKQENRASPITVQTSKDLLPNINDYDETNADDFAMEMGLACVVCRYISILSKSFMLSSLFINIHSTLTLILRSKTWHACSLCWLHCCVFNYKTNDSDHGKPVGWMPGVP